MRGSPDCGGTERGLAYVPLEDPTSAEGNGCSPVTSSDALATGSFLLLVVWPGATSSVLAPSSDALCY